MDPPPPIARAGWPISGKKESLFLEKNHEVQPVVGCGVWDLRAATRGTIEYVILTLKIGRVQRGVAIIFDCATTKDPLHHVDLIQL